MFVIVFFAASVFYAPRFLLYSSEVEEADAIVLLLGPDFKARQKEAYGLVDRGMARYLIIPAYNKILRIYDKGDRVYRLADVSSQFSEDPLNYPEYYEDTHLELLKAKKVLSGLGLHSAIFVSSPYHMRRIKIMVSKLFSDKINKFYFIPTRYEKAPASVWEFSSSEWKKLRREYGKILWFLIYFAFSERKDVTD